MKELISLFILLMMFLFCFIFPPLFLVVIPAVIVAYNQVKKEQQQLNGRTNKTRAKIK